MSGISGASRPASLSGFPEWLPAERIVEQHFLDTIRRVFELHGFASLETRAVEPLETLTRKGEIDKEVYVLRRLHAAEDEAAGAGSALRPHGAVRPVRPGARGATGLPLPPLPDPEGLAGRAPPGRPLPGVHPGRHRHRRPGHAGLPPRGRDPAGGGGRPARPADPAGADPGQQPQAGRGLLPGRRGRRHRRCAEGAGQAGQGRPGGRRRAAAVRGRPRRGGRGAMPRARRDLRRGRVLRRPGPRPGRRRPAARRGAGRAGPRRRGRRRARARARGRGPADRPGPRLLHRHRVRDPAARPRGPRLDLLGGPLRRAGLRRPRDVPGGRHLDRRLPAARPGARPGPRHRFALGADLRAGRRRRRGVPRRRRPHRRRAAGPRHRHRGRPVGGEVRQADPPRRSARHPVRLVRRRRRRARQVKDIRSGEQSPADPETWSPPAADLVPQLEEPTP